ncbi:MAG: CatB-related O-acetyltransferase [Elusimicrobia bacterium]|nr:CatB-related O-acetyltransferase [Elusimicrobiota bacterium]
MVNASTIGKFNSIGPGVYIGLWEHNLWVSTHSFYLSEACGGLVKGFKDYEKDAETATIGHDVWIGANVTVLKGVTVGHGAVLGAGSVVTKDIPPYAVAVGSPAKVLRYRFRPKDIAYLLKLRWWDFDRQTLQKMTDAGVWDSLDKVKAFCR